MTIAFQFELLISIWFANFVSPALIIFHQELSFSTCYHKFPITSLTSNNFLLLRCFPVELNFSCTIGVADVDSCFQGAWIFILSYFSWIYLRNNKLALFEKCKKYFGKHKFAKEALDSFRTNKKDYL